MSAVLVFLLATPEVTCRIKQNWIYSFTVVVLGFLENHQY